MMVFMKTGKIGASAQSTTTSHQQAKTIERSGISKKVTESWEWFESTAHEASNPKYLTVFQSGVAQLDFVKASSRHCLILIAKGRL